jgi:hypothetical protein
VWSFRFSFWKSPLLILKEEPSVATDARTFLIRGGLLSSRHQRPRARLEFREVLGGGAVLAAIHEFKPALPWPIYKWTQAIVHLWVMEGFRKHLARKP